MGHYPIKLTPDDNGTFLVTSQALPELTTFGETEAEAIQNAESAVGEALAARIATGQDVPRPRVTMAPGQAVARTDFATDAKVALYRALKERRLTRAELARRLGWHREQVDRLFRLDHASKPDQMVAAFRELGLEPTMSFRDHVTGEEVEA
jgi:antitoxin HicB